MKHSALALAALMSLAGCASGPALQAPLATAERSATVQPNANLFVQGIPPIPQSVADRVAAYNEFRGHGFVDWHPTQREMLVSHRPAGANTTQVFRLSRPMGALEPLTQGKDPVTSASYEPKSGRYVVYESASGGSEIGQIYRLDGAGQPAVQLTPNDERHAMLSWFNTRSDILYSAVPLDRTAQTGTRARIATTLYRMDPMNPAGKRKLAELDGGGWSARAISRDDRQIVLSRYQSVNESQIWLMDAESGAMRQVLPAPGAKDAPASHVPMDFTPDGRWLWFSSDRFGEFREVARLDLQTGAIDRLTAHIPWDASGGALSEDGRTLIVRVNVDGKSEVRFFDTQTLRETSRPASLPEGSLGGFSFAKKRNELAMVASGAQGPGQIYSLDAAGRLTQWTQAHVPAGVDVRRFSEQQIVRWKSFDGLTISGLINRPDPARFPGKRPVIISIHGGPEAQSTVGFLGRSNYFIHEMGIALIQPNVRGSTGYGKTFVQLDNGFKREDSVKDIGALLDWIRTQPDLDPSRVLVMGGSYGGYMTLAVSTHYADRIAGAIDRVGISHFVTFLNNTESYRRDLRRVEYGDERDPAMREHLHRISPLTNASKIKQPLFVVQGKNDPRVPYTEAEQIVAEVRKNGTPVWYLRGENEGHGFARKENSDFEFYATILFMEKTLLKP